MKTKVMNKTTRVCLIAIIAMALGWLCPQKAVAQSYISELYLASAPTSAEARKILEDRGYEILMHEGSPADFNKGCGKNTDYIFLGYKRDPNPANAITDLRFFCYYDKKIADEMNRILNWFWGGLYNEIPSNCNGDFNHNAGGMWIRLFYRKAYQADPFAYSKGLQSLTYYLYEPDFPEEERIRADKFRIRGELTKLFTFDVSDFSQTVYDFIDLNEDARGDYIYLGAKYHSTHSTDKYYESLHGSCRIGYLDCCHLDPAWNCYITEYQGMGYEMYPLQIGTKDQLRAFLYFMDKEPQLRNMHLKLTADIDMGGTELALSSHAFTGVLDGDGHTITNFSGPMFNELSGATIKNLNITVNQKDKKAGAVWGLLGMTATNTRIENCHMAGTFTRTVKSDQVCLASFLGTAKDVTIKDCSSSINFATNDIVCGLVVNMQSSTIDNCLVVNDKFRNRDYPFFRSMGEYSTLKSSYATAGTRPISDMNRNPDEEAYFYATIEDDCAYVTAEQLKSGEIAWLLNGKKDAGLWRQTLGTDKNPTGKLTSGAVYRLLAYYCDDATQTVSSEIHTGQFTNDANAAPVMGHHMEYHRKLEPTCTTSGKKEHWECTACQKMFADGGGMTEVSSNDLYISSAEGHNYVNGICHNDGCRERYQPTEVVGNTHRVYNYGQLCYFERSVIREQVWAGNYQYSMMPDLEIMSDIVANDVPICDASGNLLYQGNLDNLMLWTPICYDAYFDNEPATFTGNVYGHGHTISGLVCLGQNRAAFIDRMDDGEISELAIVNSLFESKMNGTSEGNRAAAFVSSAMNCYVYDCIANARIDSKQYAKGIAVYDDGSELGARCFFYGYIANESAAASKRYISSGEELTDANLASGEITYILNGRHSDRGSFVQKIEGDNRDLMPRLANEKHGEVVYYNSPCTAPNDYSYTNIKDRKHPDKVYHERPNSCSTEYWECTDCHAKVDYFNEPINWDLYAHRLQKVGAAYHCVLGGINEHYYCSKCGIHLMTDDKYCNTPVEESEWHTPGVGSHTFATKDTGHVRHYSCTACSNSQDDDYIVYEALHGDEMINIPVEKTEDSRYLTNKMDFTLGQNDECYTIFEDAPLRARRAAFTEKWTKGRTWGTKCLPFDFEPSENDMFKYYVPSAISLTDASQAIFRLREVTDDVIPAGTSLFVMAVDPNMESYTIYGYDADICTTELDKGVKNGTDCYPYILIGSFLGVTHDEGWWTEAYYLSEDKIWHATGSLNVKPYRAYVENIEPDGTNIKSFILVTENSEGVDRIEAVWDGGKLTDAEAVYDLGGKKLPAVQKGVNVIKLKDGSVRKVTIK